MPKTNTKPQTATEAPTLNREAWLSRAVDVMRAEFREHEIIVPPKVRVSIGFPGGASPRKRIGECWHGGMADGIPHIYVSPVIDSPVRVLDVLTHELLHAAMPDAGHKAPFARAAVLVGLEGKPTATYAGPELQTRLEALAATLGPFDHAPISLAGKKVQKTYMLKLYAHDCPEECGYLVRTTQTHIDAHGFPMCPHGADLEPSL